MRELIVSKPDIKLKRYIVHIANYGRQVLLAQNLAELLRNIEWIKSQGLSVTIVCEDKKGGN